MVINKNLISGCANITGCGLEGNIKRILPKNLSAKFTFLILNFPLLRLIIFSIEKVINIIEVINIKSILYLNKWIVIKPKIKNGILWIRIFLPNKKFLFLLTTIWNKLITIEYGNKIFKTSKKSYPMSKNVGVPNNNNPTPKTDWKIQNM